MTTSYELDVQRYNTAAYIDSDATDIVAIPRQRGSDGAGGLVWSNPPPLPAQRMRIVTSTRVNQTTRSTVDGEEVSPDFLLIGYWDADIKAGYRLLINGDLHEVVYVNADLQYEVLAEVVRRG